jgi:hypothetical protein
MQYKIKPIDSLMEVSFLRHIRIGVNGNTFAHALEVQYIRTLELC